MLLHTLRTLYYLVHGGVSATNLPNFCMPGTTKVYVGYRAADILRHVNNARYLEYFEFARWHHMARTASLYRFWSTKMYPVVGGVHLQFVRELKPGRYAFVTTEVVGAHKKSLVVHQRLVTFNSRQEEVLHASLILKASFLTKDGKTADIRDVMRAMHIDEADFKKQFGWVDNEGGKVDGSAEIQPFISQYNEADDVWRFVLKEERNRQKSGGASPPLPPL
jgi:thioesterase-3